MLHDAPATPGAEDRVSGQLPPTGYRIEQAMSAWQSARARLLADDADLAHDEAALAELLGPEAGDVKSVLSRLLQATQTAASLADAASEMLANLKGRQDRYKRRVETYRGTIFAIMDALGDRKAEFPHGTISIAAGKVAAIITDEAALPDRFIEVVTTRTPDRKAILTALKDGEVFDGATLANGLPSLMIRGR